MLGDEVWRYRGRSAAIESVERQGARRASNESRRGDDRPLAAGVEGDLRGVNGPIQGRDSDKGLLVRVLEKMARRVRRRPGRNCFAQRSDAGLIGPRDAIAAKRKRQISHAAPP